MWWFFGRKSESDNEALRQELHALRGDMTVLARNQVALLKIMREANMSATTEAFKQAANAFMAKFDEMTTTSADAEQLKAANADLTAQLAAVTAERDEANQAMEAFTSAASEKAPAAPAA